MRLIIGVTGGIASGKSTFLSILGDSGFVTISSDDIVKKLYEKDAPGYKELVKLGVKGLLDKDGNINKDALRKMVFSDTARKAEIEKLIHPLVIKEIQAQVQANSTKNIAVEIPLLFEAGLEKMCTHTVTVYADEHMMIDNISARYGITKEEAQKMIYSQMDMQTKMQKSDFVVMNKGTVEDLRNKTLELINKIKKAGH
jgi:dephospho-CoA kinase